MGLIYSGRSMNKITFKRLLERRTPKYRYIYLIAALFLIFWGVSWFFMGAHIILFPIALLCLSMTVYPTLLTWIIIVILFMTGAIHYSIVLIDELIAMRSENKIAYILGDYPVGFPLMVLSIIVLTLSMIIAKPKKIEK